MQAANQIQIRIASANARGSTVINKNEINTTNDLEFQYEDVTRKLDKKLKNPLVEQPQIPDTRHPTPDTRLPVNDSMPNIIQQQMAVMTADVRRVYQTGGH